MRPVARRCARVVLLAALCLTPFFLTSLSPAWADGGIGGGGAAGGTDGTTGAGGTGANATSPSGGGGGGGAGFPAGGAGGTGGVNSGNGGGGGTHGAVVTTLSNPGNTIQGTNGADGGSFVQGGGGGGGGGSGVVATSGGPSTNDGTLTGGMGGHGGLGGARGDGGGGGTGGAGVRFITGSIMLFTNSGTVTGGQGGRGGDATGIGLPTDNGNGGAAGAAGNGVDITSSSSIATVNNTGAITGGLGNAGGFSLTQQGAASNGGIGISGANRLTVTSDSNATITGGRAGDAFANNTAAGTGGAAIIGVTLTVTNEDGSAITGGQGGITNVGSTATGGAGGAAIIGTTSLSVTNQLGSTITGGAGGGNGGAGAGAGGAGGTAIVSAAGGTITNSDSGSSIVGGVGGTGSDGGVGLPGAAGGNGGDAISGSGLTVINGGTIAGGAGGIGGSGTTVGANGVAGNAITFTGGANTLTLQGGTISGNIALTGSLTFNQTTAQTLNSAITGTGSVIQAGTGTLTLTGASTYSGGTTITAGTLAVGSDTALGTGSVTLAGNNTTLEATASVTLSNAIVINGGVTAGFAATAGNTLTLTGSGDLNGGLGATIHFGSSTDTGTVALALNGLSVSTSVAASIDGGTLKIASNGIASVFSDLLGGITVGSGATTATLDLNGHEITTRDLTGSSAGIVTTSGGATTLDIVNTIDTTFAGSIQGNLGLAMSSSAGHTFTLTGTNTYTGGTTLNGGTLQLGTGGSLLSTGALTVNTGGTFDLNGNNQTVGTFSGTGGSVTNSNNATLATFTAGDNSATPATFAGTIDGNLAFTKQGSGTLILTGANTYTGGTTINAGTLALSGTGAIWSSTVGFTGAGATLDISQSAGSANIGGLTSTGGFGTVETGTKQLSIEGTGGSAGFSGVIQGSGALALDTNAQQSLSGINTYTGGTIIQSGATLSLTGSGSIAASSAITFGTGTFDISGTTAGASVKSLLSAVASAGTVTLGGKTLTITGNVNNTFSGVIGGSGGGLTIGDGTNAASQTLSGGNSYTGATTVNTDSTLFLSGSGSISSSNGVNLAAADATLDISGHTGTASIKTLSGSGTVQEGSNGLFVSNASTEFSGAIAGTGGLEIGGGTQTLSGVNTYSNATQIDPGATLALKGTGSIANSLFVGLAGTNATFDISQTTAGASVGGLFSLSANTFVTLGSQALTLTNGSTFAGAIQGSGSLVIGANASQTLSGANTYTGATTIQSGATLALSGSGTIASSSGVTLAASGAILDISATTSGATVNNLAGVSGATVALGTRTLTVDSTADTTYAGGFSGTGNLIKQGANTLTLSGNSTITATEVAAGKLMVMGSLTGNVTVDAGANFGGTGTITGNVTVNGTIRPDIGTMNIVGTYTQAAGSTYNVEVTAAGASDLINITGNAVIHGGTVAVSADGGTYARSTRYTILTASTGVSGTYAGVTSNLAFLRPSLSYDANDVFLTLLLTSSGFETGGLTPNQKAVGHTLDLGNAAASGDFNTVLNAISGLSTVRGPAALDAISGINYAGFQTMAVQSALTFMNAFGQQAGRGGQGAGHMALAAPANDFCAFACETESRWGVWGGGLGSFGTVAGNIDAQGYTYNLGGFAAGLDYRFDPQFTAGVAVGYTGGTLWTQGLPGQGNSDAVQLGLYGQFTQGAFYLDGLAGYAHGQNRMTRQLLVPGLDARIASGSTTVDQFFGLAEAGYKIETGTGANAYVTPFARLQGSTATQGSFSETGANALDLNVDAQTTNSLRTVLGARVGWTMLRTDLRLQVGWSHELADNSRPLTASFAGAPAFPFTLQGVQATRDGAMFGLMASAKLGEETSLYARYDGEIEGGTTSHTLSAGVRMTW